jgi:hypothetical protein
MITYKKEIILYSLFGGFGMLIVNQLGFSLHYISGLLIPVVYLFAIIMSMFSLRKRGVTNYVSFVKVGFIVSLGVSISAILVNSIAGDFKFRFPDFTIVLFILIIVGLLFSALSALFFTKRT